MAKVLVDALKINITEQKIWTKRSTIIRDAIKIINTNPSLNKFLREALVGKTVVDDRTVSRCHLELIHKAVHLRGGQVFKIFHTKFVGQYSKKIQVAFRNALQCKAKDTRNKNTVKTETKAESDEE